MAGVAITRTDLNAIELRAEAKRAKTPAVVRRILALALVLEGVDRDTAAKTCSMDSPTLRDWSWCRKDSLRMYRKSGAGSPGRHLAI